jgi:hypothetical protein
MKSILVIHVLLVSAIAADPASAGCPYLTRPSMESTAGVTRHNYYDAGSWVCFEGTMHLCQSSGAWKTQGACTNYQNWESMQACDYEGASSGSCSSSEPGSDGAGEGGGAAGGNRPGGEMGLPDIQMPSIQMPSIEFPDPFGGGSGGSAHGTSPGMPGSSGTGGFTQPSPSPSAGWGSAPSYGGGYGTPSTPAAPSSGAGNGYGGYSGYGDGGSNAFDTTDGSCTATEQELIRRVQAMDPNRGICQLAHDSRQLGADLEVFYTRCASSDPSGEWRRYAQQLQTWGRQAAGQSCDSGY